MTTEKIFILPENKQATTEVDVTCRLGFRIAMFDFCIPERALVVTHVNLMFLLWIYL